LLFVEGAIEVYGESLPAGVSTLDDAVRWLVREAEPHGYIAILAYLSRRADGGIAELRPALARQTGRVVTFGWGPRYLHSTGQYHKGGPQIGAFLQITGAVVNDIPIPGRPFTFGTLFGAQAAGDRQALSGRRRPLLDLHLTDRAAGVAQLAALRSTN
jgi:glucose-6-phosphate isomerase